MDLRGFRLTEVPADFFDDPYRYYAALREQRPVHELEHGIDRRGLRAAGDDVAQRHRELRHLEAARLHGVLDRGVDRRAAVEAVCQGTDQVGVGVGRAGDLPRVLGVPEYADVSAHVLAELRAICGHDYVFTGRSARFNRPPAPEKPAERLEGNGKWRLADAQKIQEFFLAKFKKPLPTTAFRCRF